VTRVDMDDSDKMPGWKFNECEMKGYPVRIEIGPKDIEKNQAVLVRRDTNEKDFVSLDELVDKVPALLEEVQQNLYDQELRNCEGRRTTVKRMEGGEKANAENPGFMREQWCGNEACEETLKEHHQVTSRCNPFEQEAVSETCLCCGKDAKELVIWARAY